MRRSHFAESPDVKLNWRVVTQLVPYLLEFKFRVALALFCLVLAKAAAITMPFLLKEVVDTLEQGAEQAIGVAIALVLAYGAARLLQTLLGEIRDTLFGRVTERAMRRLGLTVFEHLHKLELAFHLERKTGGLSRDIERGTSGINFLMRFAVFNILPTLLEISVVIGIFAIKYGWLFAAITFVAITAYIGFSVVATEWRTGHVRLAAKADSSSNSKAIDSLLNYETVKYFNNESFESKRYDVSLAEWEQAKRKNRLSLFALNCGQSFIIAMAMTAMMALAAKHVADQTMTLGDFVLINAFMMQLFLPLNFLGFVYREIRGSLANIERMFQLLDKKPQIQDLKQAEVLAAKQHDIVFDNVSFAYHPDRPILNQVSFAVGHGQKVAIVGDSGSGKSTLVKLLFRFYEIDGGVIRIDQQSIADVTQDSLRRSMAIVPQDTVLFNDTLAENLRYAKPDASDEQIAHVIERAFLSEFVASLPDGLQTRVGERGLKLSGGEKQRVAIARALLKGSEILVFDEATSSLDSKSESVILKALKAASQNHTSLVIAHRLSTIVDADNIIVLKQGEIVEQGDHAALLAKQGHYAQLWQLQQNEQS